MRARFRVLEVLMIAGGFIALTRVARLFSEGRDLGALELLVLGLALLWVPASGDRA